MTSFSKNIWFIACEEGKQLYIITFEFIFLIRQLETWHPHKFFSSAAPALRRYVSILETFVSLYFVGVTDHKSLISVARKMHMLKENKNARHVKHVKVKQGSKFQLVNNFVKEWLLNSKPPFYKESVSCDEHSDPVKDKYNFLDVNEARKRKSEFKVLCWETDLSNSAFKDFQYNIVPLKAWESICGCYSKVSWTYKDTFFETLCQKPPKAIAII